MRAVICAAGLGSRWNNYLGTRKHMAPIDGEPLLHRTVRLLREAGVTDIKLTYHPDHPYEIPGVQGIRTYTKEATTARKMTWPYWSKIDEHDGRTLLMLGDVFYTPETIKTMTTPIEGWHQFGRLQPSKATGKPGAEMYGWQFQVAQQNEFVNAIEAVDAARDRGWPTHVDWSLYSYMTGHDIATPANEIRDWGRHVEIPDDGTDDFDFPDDYERFLFTLFHRSGRRIKVRDFETDWYKARLKELALAPKLHRKPWEFAAIAQAIHDRYNVRPGLKALGFAVGKEPLPAWLSARGVDVVATDRPDPGVWIERQHSRGFDELRREGICEESLFQEKVQFRPVDMREIPEDLKQGQFDIVWSAGSFEHLGGITAGIEFLAEQMKCLKQGGIAVHTTEYNPFSNTNTVNLPDLCVFRQKDLAEMMTRLRAQGDRLWPIDLTPGTHPEDGHVDLPPYSQDRHLTIQLGPQPHQCTTSVLLIAARGI